MGRPAFIPTEETGKLIAAWCNEGVEPSDITQRVGECKSITELLALFQSTDIDSEETLQIFKRRKEDLLNLKSNGVESL